MESKGQPPRREDYQSDEEFILQAPLLKSLDARIRTCSTLQEWAILRAQQGLYLARTSRIDEAAGIPNEIRAQFRGREEPEVYLWIWLLEAVENFYRTASTGQCHLLHRVYAMSKSMGWTAMAQYSAAWLANSAFQDDDYSQMNRFLSVTGMHDAEYSEAGCRACMVAAVAMQSAGRTDSAGKWFGLAREIARRIGDRASVIASIQNRAIMRLDRLWVRQAIPSIPMDNIVHIKNELLGALEYERVTGSDAFVVQGDVARVRLLILQERYDAAAQHIDSLPIQCGESVLSVARSLVVVREWLRVRMDDLYVPSFDAISLAEASIESLDVDDAAVSWLFLSEVARRIGDVKAENLYVLKMVESGSHHQNRLLRLEAAVAEISDL